MKLLLKLWALVFLVGVPLCYGASDQETSTSSEVVISTSYPVNYERLYFTFFDYEQFYYTFYAGYEMVDITTTLDKGSPRIGLMLNMKFWGYASAETMGFHPLTYGVYHSITARLTSSAEQNVSNSSAANNSPDNEKAFEIETQLFWPVARTKLHNVQCHFGPIITAGGKKSKKPHVDGRFYGGFRLANNPEFYSDLLLGKTHGLDSVRLEFRGQMPVKRINKESEFFLGLIGNIGVTSEKNQIRDALGNTIKAAEEDIVRLYVIWNVNFDALFKK